jgi:hypothetical protein
MHENRRPKSAAFIVPKGVDLAPAPTSNPQPAPRRLLWRHAQLHANCNLKRPATLFQEDAAKLSFRSAPIILDCELFRSNAVGNRIVVHRRMLPGFIPSIGISWC